MPIRSVDDLRAQMAQHGIVGNDQELLQRYATDMGVPIVQVANTLGYNPDSGMNSARMSSAVDRWQANLLDASALEDLERVRSLLDDLENKQSVAELLETARAAESTRIFIGSENRLFALSGSSVIASPYRDREGKVVGVLGVIGPTRLNYARVVPMVDFTARSLGKIIG